MRSSRCAPEASKASTASSAERWPRGSPSSQWRRTAYRSDDDLVFGHPTKGTPIDTSKLARRYFKPALTRAGIERPFRPFHDLRHTSLTHAAAAGNPQIYVQARAGHSNGAITERYMHAAQILFPGAAERSEARMFGASRPSEEHDES